MRFNNNEEAVSPVIGVILMVAITVILAAVIAVFVFGMADDVQKNHNVAVTSKMPNDTAVMFTYQGGPDAGIVDNLNLTAFGSDGQFNSGATYTTTDGSFDGGHLTWDSPVVGESLTVGGLPASGRITITAYFTDGTNQQLVDKSF